MKRTTMKNFFGHIIAATTIAFTFAQSQQFDLMNVKPSDKAATSSQFTVTQQGIEQFTIASLTHPFATITGDTLSIGGVQNTTSVAAGGTMPTQSSLQQNFPNPFNNSTVIRFSVEKESDVTITVYDIAGREVKTLVNEAKRSGTFSVGFSNDNVASGTYIYRMTARTPEGKTTVDTKKMIVMK